MHLIFILYKHNCAYLLLTYLSSGFSEDVLYWRKHWCSGLLRAHFTKVKIDLMKNVRMLQNELI